MRVSSLPGPEPGARRLRQAWACVHVLYAPRQGRRHQGAGRSRRSRRPAARPAARWCCAGMCSSPPRSPFRNRAIPAGSPRISTFSTSPSRMTRCAASPASHGRTGAWCIRLGCRLRRGRLSRRATAACRAGPALDGRNGAPNCAGRALRGLFGATRHDPRQSHRRRPARHLHRDHHHGSPEEGHPPLLDAGPDAAVQRRRQAPRRPRLHPALRAGARGSGDARIVVVAALHPRRDRGHAGGLHRRRRRHGRHRCRHLRRHPDRAHGASAASPRW